MSEYQKEYQKKHRKLSTAISRYPNTPFTLRKYSKWLQIQIDDKTLNPGDIKMFMILLAEWNKLNHEERVEKLIELNEIATS